MNPPFGTKSCFAFYFDYEEPRILEIYILKRCILSCSSTKTAQLTQNFEHLFWDQSVLLVIILQLYDDIMIFQYKTTTLKHNRTWTPTPSPNGLGGDIKVGQETQEGRSKVRNIFMDSYIILFYYFRT